MKSMMMTPPYFAPLALVGPPRRFSGHNPATFLITAILLCLSATAAVAQDVYVAGFAARKLYHLSGQALVRSIPPSGHPFHAVLTADGAYLYVSERGHNTVTVISTADDTVTNTIPVPDSPSKMAIGNGDMRLYVAHNTTAAPHVTVIDITAGPGGRRNVPVASIDLSMHGAASAFALATHGERLVVGTHTGHILLYDTSVTPARFLRRRDVGARINRLLFSPLGSKIYALLVVPQSGADESGEEPKPGNLHVLRSDSLALKTVIAAGHSQLEGATLLNRNLLYVTDARGVVHVIDIGTDSLNGSIQVGKQLSGIAAVQGRIIVADIARDLIETITAPVDLQRRACQQRVKLESHSAPDRKSV